MFKLLKEKIKSAVAKISEKIEEEGKTEDIEVPIEQTKPQHPKSQNGEPIPPIAPRQEKIEPKKGKKGFFSSITSLFRKTDEGEKDKGEESQKEISDTSQAQEQKQPEELLEGQKEHEPDPKNLPVVAGEMLPMVVKDRPHGIIPVEEQKIHLPQHSPRHPIVQTVAGKIKKPKRKLPKKSKIAEPIKEIRQGETPNEEKTRQKQPLKDSSIIQEQKYEKPEHGEETKHEEPKTEEKKGFFSSLREKILTTKITVQQFEEMFFELELALLENNVAIEVIGKIRHDLGQSLVDTPIRRSKIEETIILSLKNSIRGLFEDTFDVLGRIKGKTTKPYIIAFVGINGSGKTTSIAKFASFLKNNGLTIAIAAADTFRAASIEQISLHGEKLGIKVIKHGYGADPAAVAFDAIKHAQAKGVDVVLIDTAGRMQNNSDLVNEMKKIMRVAKPDLKIFVGESITGNDCVEQARSFNEAIGIDGIILSKADVDEKGGAAISVSYVTQKPIFYLGTGQGYDDLTRFRPELVVEQLGLTG